MKSLALLKGCSNTTINIFVFKAIDFHRKRDMKNPYEKKKIQWLPILNLFLLIALTIALIVVTKINNSDIKNEIGKLSKDNKIYGIIF